MNKSCFGSHLAYFRRKEKLSQERLSSILHCAPSTISRWETGIEFPNMESFQKLDSMFESFGINYSELAMEDQMEFIRLKDELLELIYDGRAEEIDKAVERFTYYMDKANAEHKQFQYLATLMVMRRRGMSAEDFINKSTEIFSINRDLPDIEDIRNLHLTRIEHMIIYKMGLAYLEDGRVEEAEKIFEGLIENDLLRNNNYHKKRCISVSTTLASVKIRCRKFDCALKCLKYSFKETANGFHLRDFMKCLVAFEMLCVEMQDEKGSEIINDFLVAANRLKKYMYTNEL